MEMSHTWYGPVQNDYAKTFKLLTLPKFALTATGKIVKLLNALIPILKISQLIHISH